jgi:hypothetical protein
MNTLQANDYNQTVSNKTASYTLVAADKGTRVVMNVASSNTVTVNTSLFSAGDTLVIQNIGAGVTTVTAGTATVSSAGPLTISQYGSGTLYFTSAGVSLWFPSAGPAASSALNFIASTTFTTASTLTMANVFSSTYKNYLILISSLVASADAGEARVNLGTSSTKDTGNNYDFAVCATNNGSASNSQTLDTNHIKMLASYVGTSMSCMSINIFNPNVATQTNLVSNNFGNRSLYLASEICNGYIGTTTQYTDFFLSTAGAPTHEATITVYGYANS